MYCKTNAVKQLSVENAEGDSATQLNDSESPKIVQVRSARTLQADIVIQGLPFKGFIDPGSEISIISLVAYKKMLENTSSLVLQPTNISVSVANESPMVVLGTVSLNCTWVATGSSISHIFFVSDHTATPVLLCIDLLDAQDGILNLIEKCLGFCGK